MQAYSAIKYFKQKTINFDWLPRGRVYFYLLESVLLILRKYIMSQKGFMCRPSLLIYNSYFK